MWKQTMMDRLEGGLGKEDKHQQVNSQQDSGFLSGSNLISSELSIDSDEERERDESKVAPEPMRAADCGFDLGLNNDVSDLSLKGDTGNFVDNGKEATVNILDSGNCEHLDTEELKSDCEEDKNEEPEQEPWKLYFAQDDDGDTQLHISIVQGYLEAAFILVNMSPHPCLLNILNDNAQTAMHLAVLTHQPLIVRRLILAGADPSIRNFKGNTALHIACDLNEIGCAKALTTPFTQVEQSWLELGKQFPSLPQNLEQRNFNGETCLHIAASKGHIELVYLLIRLGADPESREYRGGRTALHLAVTERHRDVVYLLARERRSCLSAVNYAGLTAYHLALGVDEGLAQELVQLGASPTSLSNNDTDEDSSDDDDESDDDNDEIQNCQNGIDCRASMTRVTSNSSSLPTVVPV